MTMALVVIGIILGELYVFHSVTSYINIGGWLPEGYGMGLVEGVTNGILLNHFWFDSFFWRFNNPSARQWMQERYRFLFPSKPV